MSIPDKFVDIWERESKAQVRIDHLEDAISETLLTLERAVDNPCEHFIDERVDDCQAAMSAAVARLTQALSAG